MISAIMSRDFFPEQSEQALNLLEEGAGFDSHIALENGMDCVEAILLYLIENILIVFRPHAMHNIITCFEPIPVHARNQERLVGRIENLRATCTPTARNAGDRC